ncbi:MULTISPECIES: MFS transporter [Bacillus]|uniref:MFS transporter n=1 Tax=Bacillus TaxID=1386 RepID=UPI000BEDEEEE|nr:MULTISPECIES: MFS transporter [Bacillus cereus group]MCH5471495.1 MFS transporter [Bacillus toyonensis]MCU5490223.1 MFS transporter [Bacillus cereus]PDZ93666.1 MFS transporter [Bacillus thuringiensis]PED74196.1 MFS transporter [Bacillus toyonensis]PFR85363.1 MFS transporter [Bacillus cereus]
MEKLYILKNRTFLSFFIASLITMFGEGIFSLASIVIISKSTGSVMSIGYMLIVTMLPSVFLAPIVGVVIDRFNKAKIAVACNIARFLFIAMVPLLSYLGISSLFVVYASIFLSYIVWYILGPTAESMIKVMLEKDQYMQGTSLTQASWQVGLMSSAILAGLLLKHLGTNYTLLFTSLVYLLGAFLYFRLCKHYVEEQHVSAKNTGYQNYFKDITVGWKYFIKNKGLLCLGLAACVATPFFSSINILIAPFNSNILHGNEFTLGLIDSAAGIGSFISVAFCLWLSARNGSAYYLMLSFLMLGGFTILFSTSSRYSEAFILYIIIGFFVGNVKVLSKSLVYKYVDQLFVGRVMTLISMLGLILGIVASIAIGYLGERNIVQAYYAVGICLAIPIVLTALGILSIKKQGEGSEGDEIVISKV